MNLNIRGNKVKITDAMRSYLEEKLGKLDKYFEHPDEINANVVVRIRGIEQIVEVTIQAKKMILRGEESNKDFYAATDFVTDKIERQIRKNKTRMTHKKNRENVLDFNINFEVEDKDENKIVKRKVLDMKPMNEEEAILQMNLLGHSFFVFERDTDQRICILYERKDENYGIIETN